MINIPLTTIKEKILESTDLTEEQLSEKIKAKLDQLSGLISEEGAAHIIANELGVKLIQTSGKLEIKNILAGMRNVEVVGKVARKYEVRSFHSGERSGKVGSFSLADETGFTRVTMWNEQTDKLETFKEGDVVVIKSAYCKENNGRNELHLNQGSEIEINPKGVTIDVDITKPVEAARKKLVELSEQDSNVEVLATIVQTYEPKFFPAKNRKENEPEFGVVMNLFIDDGSDNVRTVLWREQVQNLLGLKYEDLLKFKDAPESFEPTKNDLLGNIVKIRGRVKKNDMFDRLELTAYEITKNPNPEEEIQKLKEAPITKVSKAEEVPTAEAPKEEVEVTAELKVEKQEVVTEKTETTEETGFTTADKVEEPKKEELDFNFDDDDIISVDDL